jgi:hypothetical protein
VQKKPSFPGSLGLVAIAVLGVLLLQAGSGVGGDEAGTGAVAALASGDVLSDATVPGVPGLAAETTVTPGAAATDPPTTAVVATDPPTTAPPPTDPPTTAPPPTDPPTTAPPPTDPPTTAPPPTDPPTTAPPPTDPPTTAPNTTAPVVIGPNTLPPPINPPAGTPSSPGGGSSVAIGTGSSGSSGPAGAFKSVMKTVGSTAAAAAEHMVMPAVRKLVRLPAVRKLAESQPVVATKQAVALVTEELSQLKPATVVPYLWLALLALLVTTGAFLRLWWAPPDWPSVRSLAVGSHRRAGEQPRQLGWQVGWPASPPPRSQRTRDWIPPLPGATGLAARRLPSRVGIDVSRLRAAPPPGKPVFTGQDDPDPT